MTHCVNLILDKIVTHLITKCQTDISEDDLTYADTVKKGMLQENKITRNVGIGVTGGDHDDPYYIDGIITLDELKKIGFQAEPREIGGGELWWRRGTIRVEAFFVREKLTEEEAFEAGYEILGRVQNNLQNINLTGTLDSYGEQAIKIFSYANTYFESGGRPNQYIFRGKVFWSCLTERP